MLERIDMKPKLLISVGMLMSTGVADANIISGLWKQLSTGSEDISKQYDGIEKRYITNNMYVYKLSKKQSMAVESQSIQSTVEVTQQPVESVVQPPVQVVAQHTDVVPTPVKTQLDPHVEVADTAVINEKQVLYGDASPLRDDAVAAAWEHAREAERRLQQHREYMDKVRQARKNVSDAKRVSGAINQTVGE